MELTIGVVGDDPDAAFGFKPKMREPELKARLRAWIENIRNDPILAMLDEPANERQEYVLKDLETWLDNQPKDR